MRKPIVNIIGAGRLGKTVGKLIRIHGAGTIQAVCNSTLVSSKSAIEFIGQGAAYGEISSLPAADITLIAVPDDKIKETCLQLIKHVKPNNNSIIIHCSGSLSSETLADARHKGYLVASAHPIRSFADPQISVDKYEGTYCAIEGDEKAVTTINSLFSTIGSITFKIDSSKKSLYHAALVIASNYLVGLSEAAIKSLNEAGIDNEKAINIVLDLMQGTLHNLFSTRSPKDSLTGPIKRGDIETIKGHTKAIEDPAVLNLYKALGKALLKITDHGKTTKSNIQSTLSTNNSTSTESENITKIKAKL